MLRLLEGNPEDGQGASRDWYELNTSMVSRMELLNTAPTVPGWEVYVYEFGSWDAYYKIDDCTILSATFTTLPDKANEWQNLELPEKETEEIILSETDKTFSISLLRDAPSGFYEYVKTTVELHYDGYKATKEDEPILAEVLYESNREACELLELAEMEQLGMRILHDFISCIEENIYGPIVTDIQAS